MITINNVKVEIGCAVGEQPQNKKFGFDFQFKKGLNILTGSNTSGKSTVLSVIYYCLGMEQLLGGNKKDILDQSLSRIFRHKGREYSVLHSEAFLQLVNSKNEKATLHRTISGINERNFNNISVKIDDKEEIILFLHSRGDSDTNAGFYSWLAEYAGVNLPIYDDDGKRTKVLYLQQIFAACFVEQTKGWSDFFAQLPFFNTKNPKTKIIEYLLGLNELVNEFRIDLLKEKEKAESIKWFNTVSSYNQNAAVLNFKVGGLSELVNKVLGEKQIAKLELLSLDESGKSNTFEDVRSRIIKELDQLEMTRVKIGQRVEDKDLLTRQELLITEIRRISGQIESIHSRKVSEQQKISSYKAIIKDYNNQIDLLSGEEKTKGLLHIHADGYDRCPVCDSELSLNENFEFSNLERLETDQSILFYKTERALYEDYIKKSQLLLANYQSVESYLQEQLSFNQLRLQEVKRELTEDERLPSRSIISDEVNLRFQLTKLDNLMGTFEKLKIELVNLSNQIAAYKSEIKHLNSENETDETRLSAFKSQFKRYLREFVYTSHDLRHIEIADNSTIGRLLPVVQYNEDIQSIRLSSSASDFIRALWAFYLSLLKVSNLHPGFLVFDEPGQHAMSFQSLRKLIEKSILFRDRQIILAISSDKTVLAETKDVILLDDLLKSFTPSSQYHINRIPTGEKSISPLRSL